MAGMKGRASDRSAFNLEREIRSLAVWIGCGSSGWSPAAGTSKLTVWLSVAGQAAAGRRFVPGGVRDGHQQTAFQLDNGTKAKEV